MLIGGGPEEKPANALDQAPCRAVAASNSKVGTNLTARLPEARRKQHSALVSDLVGMHQRAIGDLVSRSTWIEGHSHQPKADTIANAARFYELKLERQLRGLYAVSLEKGVDAYLRTVSANSKQMSQIGLAGYELKGPSDLMRLREDVLAFIPPHERTNGQRKIIQQYLSRLGTALETACSEQRPIMSIAGQVQINWLGFRHAEAFLRARMSACPEQAGWLKAQHDALRRTDELSLVALENLALNTPSVLETVTDTMTRHFRNRSSYAQRKIAEVAGIEAVMIANGITKEQPLHDFCCGTGDLTIIYKSSGYQIRGSDINSYFLALGRGYHTIILGPHGAAESLKNEDVTHRDFSDAAVWVAKHPCAEGVALPDEIIGEFFKSKDAQELYLLTCCAGKSKGCCPQSYVDAGLITETQWDDACRRSRHSEDVPGLQQAMREINSVRLQAAQALYSRSCRAELYELRGSDMNQLLVIRK